MTVIQINKNLDFIKDLVGHKFPINIVQLCSTLGIDLVFSDKLHNDGYIYCNGGTRIIFINSKILNTHRKKFIIAHEIGHYMLHNDTHLQGCNNIYDTFERYHIYEEKEYEANYFASELLLPKGKVIENLSNNPITFDLISRIAFDYDVSMKLTSIKSVEN